MNEIIYTDDLTGVKNRRYLKEIRKNPHDFLTGAYTTFTVVMTDIDYFKSINDTYGHLKGDEVIKEYAKYLVSNLRKNDIVIRYGGDEFIVFQPGLNREDSKIVWQRMIDRLKKENIAGLSLGISVGLASYPEDEINIESLIKIADEGLYEAKRGGRGRIGLRRKEQFVIPAREFINRRRETEEISEGVLGQNVIFIMGEAGVGKTRLVREALSRLRGNEVLWSDCVPFSRQLAYYPLRSIIKYKIKRSTELLSKIPIAYKVEISKIVPEVKDFIADRDLSLAGDVADRYRLYEGLVKVIASGDMPKVIIVDNIQWVDDDSIEALKYIIRNPSVQGNFIFISRIEEQNENVGEFLRIIGRERRVREIKVSVFEKSTTFKLTKAIIGEGYDEHVYEYIFKSSGGNPFYVEELVKSLIDNNLLPEKGDRFVSPEDDIIPRGIEDVVERKFKRLSPESQELLKMSSVLGYVDLELSEKVTGFNEGHIIGLIEEGTENGFLKETEDLVKFRGEVIRDIIYRKEVGKLKRKFLHKQIGEFLSKRDDVAAEELAYHYKEGKDTENMVLYSLKAAQNAYDMYAYKEAIKFYNWAKEKIDEVIQDGKLKVEDKINLFIKQADALNILGFKEEAEKTTKEAIALAKVHKNREKEGDAIIELATIHWNIGKNKEALEEGLKVLKIAEENGYDWLKLSALNIIGIGYNNLKDYSSALKYYEMGLKLAKETNDLKMQGIFLNNMSIIYGDLAEYDKSLQSYFQSLEIASKEGQKLQEGNTLNNIGAIYHDTGRYDEAIAYYQKALETCKYTGDRNLEATVFGNLGMINFAIGNTDKALSFCEKALKISREIDDRMQYSHTLNDMADIYLAKGEFEKSEEYYKRALEIAVDIKDKTTIIYASVGLGDVYLKKGDFLKSKEFYEKALKISNDIADKVAAQTVNLALLELYITMENRQKAEECFKSLIQLNEEIKSLSRDAYTVSSMATYYKFLRDCEKLRKSVESLKDVDDASKTPSIRINEKIILALIHLHDKEFKNAINVLKEAWEIAEKCGYLPQIAEISYYLAKVYELMNNPDESMAFLQKAHDLFTKLNIEWKKEIISKELEAFFP